MDAVPANRRILIIDDNRSIHEDFRKILLPGDGEVVSGFDAVEAALFGEKEERRSEVRFELDSAYQGEEGIARVEEALRAGRPYAMAFVDVRMPPGLDGIETTRQILTLDPRIQIAICTAYSDYSWKEIFTRFGHHDGLLILKKPFDAVEALQMAYTLTEKWRLHEEARRRMEDLENRVALRTAELQKERDFAENIIQTANLMFVQLDTDGAVIRVNSATATSTGYRIDEIVGRSWFDLFVPREDKASILEHFERVKGGEPCCEAYENEFVTRTGERRQALWKSAKLLADGEFVGTISFGLDVTERNRLRDQIHRIQRMDTVGKLAGGVAHEFNNLLMSILGQAELLLVDLPEGSPLREGVLAIQQGGDRAAELTRQLLAYGRRQLLRNQVINLNDVVRGIEAMIDHVTGRNIVVRFELEPNLYSVKADPGQLEQVVLNLVANATDAMPAGGALVLKSTNVTLNGDQRLDPELKPGDYVTLEVADTGSGIDRDVMANIFEPFFSTKGMGRGTGLGLSTSYGILKQSGGTLTAESESGRGSSFTLILPKA